MMSNPKGLQNKIIFGLKIRQLRTEQDLSFARLAEQTGMSVSYLNEIEKGKKYPKDDKIALLANALQTTSESLISGEMPKHFAPIEALLQSNFLNDLPLDLFGIELNKVVEIIANAPLRVGAFISTLVELSRNYALREENFYFAALRAYLELHLNYFDDLEEAARDFAKQHKVPSEYVPSPAYLANLLEKKFGYQIVENGLDHLPDLNHIRSIFVPRTRQFLLNSQLSEAQKAFQFGKELGFNYLHLKERANTASLLRVKTFEEALNHYKAGYFSAALLMHREQFVKDVAFFLKKDRWDDGHFLLDMLQKYQASPELLCQRLTNILPKFFGLQKMFFLRFIHDRSTGKVEINKELHLNRRHHPHANGLDEHYCRRWISISLLQDLATLDETAAANPMRVGIQRSHYFDTTDEYLCLTIVRRVGQRDYSTTIGILVEPELRQKIKFVNDPNIPRRTVGTTCERCAVVDCAERAHAPTVVLRKAQRGRTQAALKKLLE
jgi:XRE family transcriptional regulator, fatty acid utilization regulator